LHAGLSAQSQHRHVSDTGSHEPLWLQNDAGQLAPSPQQSLHAQFSLSVQLMFGAPPSHIAGSPGGVVQPVELDESEPVDVDAPPEEAEPVVAVDDVVEEPTELVVDVVEPVVIVDAIDPTIAVPVDVVVAGAPPAGVSAVGPTERSSIKRQPPPVVAASAHTITERIQLNTKRTELTWQTEMLMSSASVVSAIRCGELSCSSSSAVMSVRFDVIVTCPWMALTLTSFPACTR